MIYYDDKREVALREDFEHINSLFKTLQLFISGTHHDLIRDLEVYSTKEPNTLLKRLNYFDETLYTFLALIPVHYGSDFQQKIKSWSFFEDHLRKLIKDESSPSANKLLAIKYFYNKSEREKVEKDSSYIPKFYDNFLLPLSEQSEADLDIVFMHGNQSHPIRAWCIEDELGETLNAKWWPKEYLIEDLKDLNPRILFWGYETFQSKSDYIINNIPEDDIYQLSDKVTKSFHKAGVGNNRPTILVCFSMGGIIAKIILKDDNKIAEKTKGVVFIATPHFGSDVRDDTVEQLQDIISGMNSFISNHSIPDEEFVANILDNLKISHIAKFLVSENRKEYMKQLNDEYLKLKINDMCIIEGKKIYKKLLIENMKIFKIIIKKNYYYIYNLFLHY